MVSHFKIAGGGWRVVLVALTITFFASVGWAQSGTLAIQPGYNFLATTPGSYTTLNIPQGFFGEKNGVASDAIVNRVVNIEGRPMGTLGLSPSSNIAVSAGNCHSGGGHYHCHKATADGSLVDTITQVSGATLGAIGSSATVQLRFVALSLQTPSSAPLQVTYGGTNPSYFHLILTLDSSQSQPEGSITMTRTSTNGGQMVVRLPVNFKVTFRGGSSGQQFGPVAIRTVLESSDNTFTVAGAQ